MGKLSSSRSGKEEKKKRKWKKKKLVTVSINRQCGSLRESFQWTHSTPLHLSYEKDVQSIFSNLNKQQQTNIISISIGKNFHTSIKKKQTFF